MYKRQSQRSGSKSHLLTGQQQEESLNNIYLGKFWCHIRKEFNTWKDHINFYKINRL